MACISAVFVACKRTETRPKLVVLLSIDTLSRAALRAFNPDAPQLSNLDDFSAESVRFTQAYSTASWTLPAHGSLLTGLYPHRHGATVRRAKLSPDAWRLASAMRHAGFATVGFSDGGYVSGGYGFADGFVRYNHHSRGAQDALASDRLPRKGRPNGNKGTKIFDRAISVLENFDFAAQPLFLFLQTYSVHDYFKQNRWALDALNLEPTRDTSYFVGCIQGARRCSRKDWARLNSLYFAELDNLDKAFGQLVDAVDSAVSTSESIFIVLSDHGEGFDPVHGRIHHGGRLHSDQIHVPLMVRTQFATPKTVSGLSVSLVDIPPTIMEMIGSTAPTDLDGRSFAPFLDPHSKEPAAFHRDLFAMEHFHSWEHGRRRDLEGIPQAPLATASIRDDHLYIAHESGAEEIYHMASDPTQLHNLAPLLGDSQELSGARASVGALEFGEQIDSIPTQLSEEVEEQLESLGYIQR